MNKVDMVILRMVDNIVLIEDRYSESNKSKNYKKFFSYMFIFLKYYLDTSNPPSLDQTLNS